VAGSMTLPATGHKPLAPLATAQHDRTSHTTTGRLHTTSLAKTARATGRFRPKQHSTTTARQAISPRYESRLHNSATIRRLPRLPARLHIPPPPCALLAT